MVLAEAQRARANQIQASIDAADRRAVEHRRAAAYHRRQAAQQRELARRLQLEAESLGLGFVVTRQSPKEA